MFTTDTTIVDLRIKERNLYKAIFSMNLHQIATPGLGVEDSRCYIFFFREGDKLSAYIVLYMPSSGRQLYYSYSSNPFPEADLPMVEDVARAFGEDMGFSLDEKSFASSSTTEKNLWIDEQPLFELKAPEETAVSVPSAKTTTEPAAEQPAIPAAVDQGMHASTETPAPPVAQTAPSASESRPVPAAPAAQPTPAAPAVPQSQTQPMHNREIEIKPQVEEDVEEEAHAPRQEIPAVQRTARAVKSSPPEEEYRASLKPPTPKQQVKKESRVAIGVVGREMEALARLMASF